MNKMSFGWVPDLPDFRDYHVETPAIKVILDKSQPLAAAKAT